MSSIPIPGTFSHNGMSSSGAIPVVSEVGTTCTNQRVHRSRDPVMFPESKRTRICPSRDETVRWTGRIPEKTGTLISTDLH